VNPIFLLRVASPLGELRLVASADALTGLYFPEHRHAPRLDAAEGRDLPVLIEAATELAQYFRGERREFAAPLAPQGSEFQLAVWRELQRIPFGERRTYSEIAVALGRPDACRAIGAAVGRNPLSIVVPCHRVVGSGGSLTGYAGGMDAKRWLLVHEQAVLKRSGGSAGQRSLF